MKTTSIIIIVVMQLCLIALLAQEHLQLTHTRQQLMSALASDSSTLANARDALQAQGNALDECMKALDPTWKFSAAPGHKGT
jgi:hypothetical protein